MPSFLPTQQPVVADLKSCEAWLARAALADARQACRELTALLESLEEVSPPEAPYVEILERLREPIVVAQAEHGKKFAGRPLPLKDFEIGAFEQVSDLWTHPRPRLQAAAPERDRGPQPGPRRQGGAPRAPRARLRRRAHDGPLPRAPRARQRAVAGPAPALPDGRAAGRDDDHRLGRPPLEVGVDLQRGVRARAAPRARQPARTRVARAPVDAPLGIDVGVQGRARRGGRGRAGLRGRPRRQPAAGLDQGRRGDVRDAVPRDGESPAQRAQPREEARIRRRPADARARQGLRPARRRAAAGAARARVGRGARAAPVHAPAGGGARRARERARVDPRRDQRQGVQERRRRAALGLLAPRRRADPHLPGRARVGYRGGRHRVRRREVGDARRERERLPHPPQGAGRAALARAARRACGPPARADSSCRKCGG